MPDDDRRPPGRLRPPRPDYGWEPPPSESPPRRSQPAYPPTWEPDRSSFDDEDIVDDHFRFGPPYDSPASSHSGGPTQEYIYTPEPEPSHGMPDRNGGGRSMGLGGPPKTPPPPPPRGTERVMTGPVITAPPLPISPGGLSVQDRYQILIDAIRLYSDEWKLAGIRSNANRNRLEAYLVPLNHPIDLKQAISKNVALVIFIDAYGNTDIREPKSKGPLRWLKDLLFGAE